MPDIGVVLHPAELAGEGYWLWNCTSAQAALEKYVQASMEALSF